jgi:hypothetical protein
VQCRQRRRVAGVLRTCSHFLISVELPRTGTPKRWREARVMGVVASTSRSTPYLPSTVLRPARTSTTTTTRHVNSVMAVPGAMCQPSLTPS